LIEQCPKILVKKYNSLIIESQITIIKNLCISYGGISSKDIFKVFKLLAIKLDDYADDFETMKATLDLVFKEFKEVGCQGRRILDKFMDRIKRAYQKKHFRDPRRGNRFEANVPENPFPTLYELKINEICNEILSKTNLYPRRVDTLRDGYSKIQSLINETDIMLYLCKMNTPFKLDKPEFFISYI
jgi:hypothetical protein